MDSVIQPSNNQGLQKVNCNATKARRCALYKVSHYMLFRCVALCNVKLRDVRSRQIKLNIFERGNVNAKSMRDICTYSKIEP